MLRLMAITLAAYAVAGGILFASAGRTDLPMFWAYTLALVLLSVGFVPLLESRHPGLVAERLRPGPGERDRAFVPAGNAAMVVAWIVAGLDAGRFHPHAMPLALQLAGLALALAGYVFTAAAMLENRWFSSAVRLQSDREQQLVTTGPYAWVRHPGYTGGLGFTLGTPLALGSWWAFVPLAVMVALVLRRTRIEDAMLRAGLPGYAAYAARVRWRLLPGAW